MIEELKKLKTGDIIRVNGSKLKVLIKSSFINDVLAVMVEKNINITPVTFYMPQDNTFEMNTSFWANQNPTLAREYRNTIGPYKNERLVWLSNVVKLGYKINVKGKLKLKDFIRED